MFSLSHISLEKIKSEGSGMGKSLLDLLEKPRELMVTLVLCNELSNAGMSIVIASIFYEYRNYFSHNQTILYSTLASTIVVILFGEIIPKSFGMKQNQLLANYLAVPMKFFFKVLGPLRAIYLIVVEFMIKRIAKRDLEVNSFMREEEFRRLVDESYQSGEIEKVEAELIHKVFEFGGKSIQEIGRPIPAVESFDIHQPLADLLIRVAQSQYSRIPIYQVQKDNIIGVLHRKFLLKLKSHLEQGKQIRIKDYLIKPVFLLRGTKLDEVFTLMRKKKSHMAFVVNEYGEVLSMVTMDDLLGQMFGELGT